MIELNRVNGSEMVWYDMVWYGTVWCGTVWYGMVWYGMVWYRMIWYGVVWYGIELRRAEEERVPDSMHKSPNVENTFVNISSRCFSVAVSVHSG